ncbi:MAG: cupin domain-containing protein [Bradymonadales bacterium]|nr:MAG: cupin domain-containing protein [Bradymonadales bacterium]
MGFFALGKRIQSLRNERSFSLEDLSRESEISVAELESYEADLSAPRIAHLVRLSKALHVNVADFFRERPATKDFEISRAKGRTRRSPLVSPSDSGVKEYQYEALTSSDGSQHMDAYLIELPPFQAERPHPDQSHPGEEFVYVIEGQIEGHINGQHIVLEAGDSIYFRSKSSHSFFNPSERVARALTVIYPY